MLVMKVPSLIWAPRVHFLWLPDLFGSFSGLVPIDQPLNNECNQRKSHAKSQENKNKKESVEGQLVRRVVVEGEGFHAHGLFQVVE